MRRLRKRPLRGKHCAASARSKMFVGFTLRALMKRSSPEALDCLSAMIPRTSFGAQMGMTESVNTSESKNLSRERIAC